jgi:hypothetical protein
MKLRLIQLNELIITPYNKVRTDWLEDTNGLIEYIFKDGAKIANPRTRIKSREIVIEGNFLESLDINQTPSKLNKPYIGSEYIKALQALQQKEVEALFIAQDNKIYLIKARISQMIITEEDGNGFDFSITLNCPNPYFADVSNFLFYRVWTERSLQVEAYRYDYSLEYFKFCAQPYILGYFKVPSGFLAFWYSNRYRTQTIQTNSSSGLGLIDDGTIGGALINDAGLGLNISIGAILEVLINDGTAGGALIQNGIIGAVLDGGGGIVINSQIITTVENILANYFTPLKNRSTVILNKSGRMRVSIFGHFGAINGNISIGNYNFNLEDKTYFVLNEDGAFVGKNVYSLERIKLMENTFDSNVEVIYSSSTSPTIYYCTQNLIL